ncbi:MAG: TIGR03618 family F420-dependent PPOX class oxidoreductase [Candidatus Limnocylindria bacterium]
MTDPDLTVARVLADDLREWLMATLRYPVLSVLAEDGSPSQSVMWFDLDPNEPDTILMNTKRGRAKDRWLRRDPRVSLCFEDGYTWAAFKGRVTLDDDPARGMELIRSLAVRYREDPARYEGQERVTIRLRVEKVVRHD